MDENRRASEDQSKSLTSFGVPAHARASNSQPASGVQILSGHYNTAVRVPLPLQFPESEMFDLGSVPYKDSDELCMACGLSAHTLSVQKGSLRYPALFEFAAVAEWPTIFVNLPVADLARVPPSR